jgi:hypothetical protein
VIATRSLRSAGPEAPSLSGNSRSNGFMGDHLPQ